MNRDSATPGNDPAVDPRDSQSADPQTGQSDDPRVDPTPDQRQSDAGAAPKRNVFGVPDPTSDGRTD